jgi:hypothetical protein
MAYAKRIGERNENVHQWRINRSIERKLAINIQLMKARKWRNGVSQRSQPAKKIFNGENMKMTSSIMRKSSQYLNIIKVAYQSKMVT